MFVLFMVLRKLTGKLNWWNKKIWVPGTYFNSLTDTCKLSRDEIRGLFKVLENSGFGSEERWVTKKCVHSKPSPLRISTAGASQFFVTKWVLLLAQIGFFRSFLYASPQWWKIPFFYKNKYFYKWIGNEKTVFIKVFSGGARENQFISSNQPYHIC